MRIKNTIFLCVLLLSMVGCGKTTVGTVVLVPDELMDNTTFLKAERGGLFVESHLPSQMVVVDAEDFKEGLESAFLASGIFAGGEKKYAIEADIRQLEYPSFATTVNVSFLVDYDIRDEHGRLVAQKSVESEGVCSMGEHFVGGVRFRRAVDRAISNQFVLVVEFIKDEISKDLSVITAKQ